ncbi:MAG TPA: hypothetical protein VL172_16675 [Kofleriaceae bacterium]|nr:hypothetical protein [Kofleriaceae bacterium]
MPLVIFVIAGCDCGGGAAQDARDPDDGGSADAADAGPDADLGPCPGKSYFTGDYVDWDSSETAFLGVFEASVSDREFPEIVDLTSPNGRTELCVGASGERTISMLQDSYIPLTFAADQEAIAAGPFTAHGLTPSRATDLYVELGNLPPNPDTTLVVVEVRHFPSGDPVIGAAVALSQAHDGAYTRNGGGAWVSGETTTDSAQVLFANVTGAAPVDGDGGTYGSTSVTVTPPVGTTCVGPATLPLGAGEISTTTFACD